MTTLTIASSLIKMDKRAMSDFDGYISTFLQEVFVILAFVAPKVHPSTESMHSAAKRALIQLQYQTIVLFPPIKLFVCFDSFV